MTVLEVSVEVEKFGGRRDSQSGGLRRQKSVDSALWLTTMQYLVGSKGNVPFVLLLIAPGQGRRSMPTDERNGPNLVEKLLNDQSYH